MYKGQNNRSKIFALCGFRRKTYLCPYKSRIFIMKQFLIISLAIFLVSCSSKWDPRAYRRVEIRDAGEIYSTLSLDKKTENGKPKTKMILINQRWVPDSLFKTMQQLSNENKWPAGLKTAKQRKENEEKLRLYRAYIATSYKGKYILYIPAKENKDNKNLSSDMISNNDFYMIIGKSGVERKDSLMKGYEHWKRGKVVKFDPSPTASTPKNASTTAPRHPANNRDNRTAPISTPGSTGGGGLPDLPKRQ